jgi:AraC family transcriptional regulator
MNKTELENNHAATTLTIKNMVCNRCIKVVKEELEKLNLDVRSIILGEAVVSGDEKDLPMTKIKNVLTENGFELIEDKKAKTIEQIKIIVIEHIYNDSEKEKVKNFSNVLVEKTGYDYNYLSSLFSSIENITIEHYFILQKIERAKELLKYGELTLSEIAYHLGYSSVQHLSNQFKKVTGLTASQFKELTNQERKPIDKILP